MKLKRTTPSVNSQRLMPNELSTFASALVGRANLAAALGSQSFGGARDLYAALGYPEELGYKDFEARYRRQDIAKAIIDRPAKATWQGPLYLEESAEAEETPLEKEWKILDNRLKLKTRFSRVDRLAGIGCYGVLLLGLNDVSEAAKFQLPVSKKAGLKLLYVKPFGQGSASISSFESNPQNERYGLPLMYQIEVASVSQGSGFTTLTGAMPTISINVHYTRVIHIIDDILENDVISAPRLEAVFNRLMDLEKLIGGDAEMFWKSARPGFQGKVNPDYEMTPAMKTDLQDQIDEYEHNLRRILVNEGVEYKALTQEISDPTNHVDVQIQMISAQTGIPKRILTGTERGELSSAQDASEWRSYVEGRRLDHAEPHIVRPFVDWCIEYGILPKSKTGEYAVSWSDLYAMSEAERVKIGMDRSTTLKNYLSSPMAEAIISPDGFRELFLGLTDNQIEILKNMSLTEVEKEQLAIALNPPPVNPPTGNTPVKKETTTPVTRKRTVTNK